MYVCVVYALCIRMYLWYMLFVYVCMCGMCSLHTYVCVVCALCMRMYVWYVLFVYVCMCGICSLYTYVCVVCALCIRMYVWYVLFVPGVLYLWALMHLCVVFIMCYMLVTVLVCEVIMKISITTLSQSHSVCLVTVWPILCLNSGVDQSCPESGTERWRWTIYVLQATLCDWCEHVCVLCRDDFQQRYTACAPGTGPLR